MGRSIIFANHPLAAVDGLFVLVVGLAVGWAFTAAVDPRP